MREAGGQRLGQAVDDELAVWVSAQILEAHQAAEKQRITERLAKLEERLQGSTGAIVYRIEERRGGNAESG